MPGVDLDGIKTRLPGQLGCLHEIRRFRFDLFLGHRLAASHAVSAELGRGTERLLANDVGAGEKARMAEL
jgi:hypothetical protein